MLIVVSPAKALDFASPLPTRKFTQPEMLDRSEELEWSDWKVASIRVTGLEHVREEAVIRELEMHPGDLYSDAELVQDANAIKNTLLFARLVVTVSPDSLDESVHVTYALKERPRFLFLPLLKPGELAGQWDYGFALQHNNVSGLGRKLTLEARTGSNDALSVIWYDPWLWKRRLGLLLAADYRDQVVQRTQDGVSSDYRRRLVRVSSRLESFLDPQRSWFVDPGWYSLSSDDHLGQRTTVNPSGRDRFTSLGVGAILNTTDIHVNPERGDKAYASVQFFGLYGPENPAGTRMDLSGSHFWSLGPVVLGVNGQLARTVGRRPEYMEHTLGGQTTVRGLSGGSWGGWSSAIAKLECRIPLIDKRIVLHRYDLALGGVIFADAGETWQDRLARGSGVRTGTGAGLRLFAPFVDVISFDAAWSRESGMQVYVYTGQSF